MNFDLPSFYSKLTSDGAIYFSGSDAVKFLQGQITCDVNKITLDHSSLGARCNLQGRVVSFFRLAAWQDGLLMLLPKSMVQLTIDSLKKYAVFFKVSIEDYSDKLSLYAYFSDQPLEQLTLPETINEANTSNDIVCIKALQKTQHSGFLLISSKDLEENLTNQLKQATSEQDESYWHVAKILEHIPNIVPATSEKYLPHELNLPELGAVSFDKGCYLGQEIVARMEYRGQVKQHLHLIQTEVIPDLQLNEYITDENGKHVGNLVDCSVVENSLLGIALIRNQQSTTKLFMHNHIIQLEAD